MRNIFEDMRRAWDRCQFPGKEKYGINIELHENGWGKHILTLTWRVPNTDPEGSRHDWRDQFGNKFHSFTEFGEPISVYHRAAFDYEDVYPVCPEGFFERLICQIHTEMQVHEALETFTVDGQRRWYPHEKAPIVCPRTGTFYSVQSWRNVLAWAGVQAAMDPKPPEVPRWAKRIVFQRKMALKRQHLKKTFEDLKRGFFLRETKWEKARFTAICLGSMYFIVAGKRSLILDDLEDWCKTRYLIYLGKEAEKARKKQDQEKLKEAA
jgi:hypothetical protein